MENSIYEGARAEKRTSPSPSVSADVRTTNYPHRRSSYTNLWPGTWHTRAVGKTWIWDRRVPKHRLKTHGKIKARAHPEHSVPGIRVAVPLFVENKAKTGVLHSLSSTSTNGLDTHLPIFKKFACRGHNPTRLSPLPRRCHYCCCRQEDHVDKRARLQVIAHNFRNGNSEILRPCLQKLCCLKEVRAKNKTATFSAAAIHGGAPLHFCHFRRIPAGHGVPSSCYQRLLVLLAACLCTYSSCDGL